MMEITPEIKAKIYSQYLPYFIGTPAALAICAMIEKHIIAGLDSKNLPDYRIELKPLSSISDEDASELAKLFDEGDHDSIYWGRYLCNRFIYNDLMKIKYTVTLFTYLQSRGYALPYMNYSVEDLVAANVYKIVE